MNKYLLLFFSIAILVGCESSKDDNNTSQNDGYFSSVSKQAIVADITLNADDLPSVLMQLGFRAINHVLFADECGNWITLVSNSFHLQNPNIDGLIRIGGIVEQLFISSYPPIEDISFLENFTQLKLLRIDWRSRINNFEPLKYLKNLESLILFNIINDFDVFLYLNNLRRLFMENMLNDQIPSDQIIDISPIKNLNNLNFLHFRSQSNFVNRESIFELSSLEELRLYLCEYDFDISNISYLHNLKDLILFSPAVIDMARIGSLQNLRKASINASGFTNLYNFNIHTLEELSIGTTSPMIEKIDSEIDLGELLNLPNLRKLSIRNLNVTNVRRLLEMANLEEVRFLGTLFDPMDILESETIKTIYVNDVDFNNFPTEIFRDRGISVRSSFTG